MLIHEKTCVIPIFYFLFLYYSIPNRFFLLTCCTLGNFLGLQILLGLPFKRNLSGISSVSNSLYQNAAQQNVGPHLGPNYLHRLSAGS